MIPAARDAATPVRRPRVVLVTRKSTLQLLLERHGTASQARFYLESRVRPDARHGSWTFDDHERAHERFEAALSTVVQGLPADQRRTRVDRDELDRFLFAPDDLVVVVGQDGLVPNVAKYLDGQAVVGVNSDPERFDGVLCRHAPEGAASAIDWAGHRDGPAFQVEERAVAVAEREDGQRLLALNEVFVGHRTHQSARYAITCEGRTERQSSSGLICATGTGCTGWGLSIGRQRDVLEMLPSPFDMELAWFVREPFPSVSTGVEMDFGVVGMGQPLVVDSEMGEGGTIFADGIESDRLDFADGHRVTIQVAPQGLRLIVPGPSGDAAPVKRRRMVARRDSSGRRLQPER